MNSNGKNTRGLTRSTNECEIGYQLTSNFVRDENCEVLADPQSLQLGGKNLFAELLDVHGVRDAGQIEMHGAEQLVPEYYVGA
jgi:hypothetical protein